MYPHPATRGGRRSTHGSPSLFYTRDARPKQIIINCLESDKLTQTTNNDNNNKKNKNKYKSRIKRSNFTLHTYIYIVSVVLLSHISGFISLYRSECNVKLLLFILDLYNFFSNSQKGRQTKERNPWVNASARYTFTENGVRVRVWDAQQNFPREKEWYMHTHAATLLLAPTIKVSHPATLHYTSLQNTHPPSTHTFQYTTRYDKTDRLKPLLNS